MNQKPILAAEPAQDMLAILPVDDDEDIDDAKELIQKYKEKLRKFRTCGLQKDGEYSSENYQQTVKSELILRETRAVDQ